MNEGLCSSGFLDDPFAGGGVTAVYEGIVVGNNSHPRRWVWNAPPETVPPPASPIGAVGRLRIPSMLLERGLSAAEDGINYSTLAQKPR